MPVTLPIEVYEIFEKGFGKESAKTVIKSLEQVIDTQVEDKWYRTKTELKEELLKDVATKADLEVLKRDLEVLKKDLEARIAELIGKQERDKAELLGTIQQNKAELYGVLNETKAELLGIIQQNKTELYGVLNETKAELYGVINETKAELLGKLDRLNLTLKYLIVLMVLALTLMNPVVAEILKSLLKL